MAIEDHIDITHARVSHDIRLSLEGDCDAAHRLLEAFEIAVRNHESISPELLAYFANCFQDIRSGTKPNQALHLSKPHRPNKRENWVRDARLAIAIDDLRRAGKTLEVAIAEVAPAHGASESTVRRAYLAYNVFPRQKNAQPRKFKK